MIIVSIVDFLGFNGFIAATRWLNAGYTAAGALGII
jgi:hypothetical protein